MTRRSPLYWLRLVTIAERALPLRISERAASDLEAIQRYSAQNYGSTAAEKYLEGIDSCFKLLQQMPLVGARRSDLDKAIRSFRYRRHLIFYDHFEDSVRIQRVLHHAQDISTALDN